MWLALLLAAADDTLEQRGRRAAWHELRQRLLPTPRDRGPALWTILVEFAQCFVHTTPAEWNRIDDDLHTFVVNAVGVLGDGPQLIGEFWSNIPGLSFTDSRAHTRNRRLNLPFDDLVMMRETVGTSTPFVPLVRTEFDALLRIALSAWGEDNGWNGALLTDFSVPQPLRDDLHTHLRSAHDWVAAMHPDLTGMTWTQVRDASQAWHATFTSDGFGLPLPPALVVLRWPDGWTFQRLTEKRDLAGEGTSMGHCVGGPVRANGRRDGESEYWQGVRENKICIFSLRDEQGVPHATVETSINGVVRQVQGPHDDDLEWEADRRLRVAFWRLGLWTSQPEMPRLGTSGVWPDAAIRALRPFVHAIQKTRELESMSDRAVLTEEGWFMDLSASLWTVADVLLQGSGVNFTMDTVIAKQGPGVTRPAWLPLEARACSGVILFGNGPAEEPDESRILMPFLHDGSVLFEVYPLDPTLGQPQAFLSLVDALRALTDVPAAPPDVSMIEAFPGLSSMEPDVSPWQQACLPIQTARRMRAYQAERLSRRTS